MVITLSLVGRKPPVSKSTLRGRVQIRLEAVRSDKQRLILQGEATLRQPSHQVRPFGETGEIDDQVDVVGRPDALQCDRVGDVERGRTAADKYEACSKLSPRAKATAFNIYFNWPWIVMPACRSAGW